MFSGLCGITAGDIVTKNTDRIALHSDTINGSEINCCEVGNRFNQFAVNVLKKYIVCDVIIGRHRKSPLISIILGFGEA